VEGRLEGNVGLRERKKTATRQALHEAAVRLTTELGFERVTVEAIADAAMVSRRTFSNYFSGKEEALLHDDVVRMHRMLDAVRARPAGEPPWTAMSRAAERLVAAGDGLDPEWLARRRLLRGYPSILAHELAMYAAVERDLAELVRLRMPAGPDALLRSRVLAATFLTTLRVATRQWLEQPEYPLLDLVRPALAYALEGRPNG
jgi:AcrR family transcriptional regulator